MMTLFCLKYFVNSWLIHDKVKQLIWCIIHLFEKGKFSNTCILHLKQVYSLQQLGKRITYISYLPINLWSKVFSINLCFKTRLRSNKSLNPVLKISMAYPWRIHVQKEHVFIKQWKLKGVVYNNFTLVHT